MNKFIIFSALFAMCSATDLVAAPVAVVPPAITSYSYETRQTHPGPAIALAAPIITKTYAAPLTLSAHLLGGPLAAPALLSPKVYPSYGAPLGSPYGAPYAAPYAASYAQPLAGPLTVPYLAPPAPLAHTLLSGPLEAPKLLSAPLSAPLWSAPLLIKK